MTVAVWLFPGTVPYNMHTNTTLRVDIGAYGEVRVFRNIRTSHRLPSGLTDRRVLDNMIP